MTQTAARRLVTEATAAATYRTAAQTAADADARIAAMLTAQKGVASGLASLDGTGKVPAAQLPPATNVPIAARITGAHFNATVGTAATAAAATPVTGMQIDGLTPGLWEVTMEGFAAHMGGGTVRGYLAAVGGLVAADSPSAGVGGTATQSGRFGSIYSTSASAVANGQAVWNQANGGTSAVGLAAGTTFVPFQMRGLLRVTTAGNLALRIDASAAGYAAMIDTGTWLSAVRVS